MYGSHILSLGKVTLRNGSGNIYYQFPNCALRGFLCFFFFFFFFFFHFTSNDLSPSRHDCFACAA